jgi:hypothetical protein
MRIAGVLVCVVAGMSFGAAEAVRQATSARVGAADATAPAGRPTMATNIDRALATPLSVTFKNDPLKNVFSGLREKTNTNLVVNWAALGKGGVTPETPINLSLQAATYEEIVRCVLEILPLKGTRGNYLVGGNALEITTTAELSKGATPRLYEIDRALVYSATGKATAGQEAEHGRLVEQVVKAELERAGEPLGKESGRTLVVKGHSLAANVSLRGHGIIERVLPLFAQPTKINTPAASAVLTRAGKETAAALAKVVKEPGDLVALAKDPAKAGKTNVVLLPGAAAELDKPAPALDYVVSAGGTVLIGAPAEIAPRHPLAIYDLRDILKRTIARSTKKPPPGAGEVQEGLVKTLKEQVPPPGGAGGTWGTVGAAGAVMTPSDGILVVVAPVATHEKIAAALAKLYR